MINAESLAPFFIVGAPRSGTTLLAVLLNRHPDVAVPPETQFFSEFTGGGNRFNKSSKEEMVSSALSFHRIADLGLDYSDVFSRFNGKQGNSVFDLFSVLLESYSGKVRKKRIGEKSPLHLNWVEEIAEGLPGSKFICIVRDGRDVVRSLGKVNWAEPGNPRRMWVFCTEWNDLTEKTLRLKQVMPADTFHILSYEELVRNPEQELNKVCHFLGIPFTRLMMGNGEDSEVIPEWEKGWKSKAAGMIDQKRIQPWKTEASQADIWFMNIAMRENLVKLGYGDVGVTGCPALKRYRLELIALACSKRLRPYTLQLLKVWKFFKDKI